MADIGQEIRTHFGGFVGADAFGLQRLQQSRYTNDRRGARGQKPHAQGQPTDGGHVVTAGIGKAMSAGPNYNRRKSRPMSPRPRRQPQGDAPVEEAAGDDATGYEEHRYAVAAPVGQETGDGNDERHGGDRDGAEGKAQAVTEKSDDGDNHANIATWTPITGRQPCSTRATGCAHRRNRQDRD